jgi:hypothetical protein
MALRYSYSTEQGGWVLDNKGSFQTPFRIGQHLGEYVYGYKAYQGEDGLEELRGVDGKGDNTHPDALVLSYGRNKKDGIYIDPKGQRGLPPPPPRVSRIPQKHQLKFKSDAEDPAVTFHRKDLMMAGVVVLVVLIVLFIYFMMQN